MTVSTTSSAITVLGNDSTVVFTFPFIGVSASDIIVIYTNASGVSVTLTSSQYTLALNPALTGQSWGIGGTVTYPIAGTPIASGTSLTIERILPLVQNTSISNQGNFYPQVTESALDILCMEVQQVSNRTTQFRGVWATGLVYNYGDIIQDGANGANTSNFYICTNANTSGVWATDLANGYWSISVNIQQAILAAATATAQAASATASAASAAASEAAASSNITNRIVTASGDVTIVAADHTVEIAKSTPATTNILITTSGLTSGKYYTIKDGLGNFATYPATLVLTGGTIDGASTYLLNRNWSGITFYKNSDNNLRITA